MLAADVCGVQVIDNNSLGVKGWMCRNEHAGAFAGTTAAAAAAAAAAATVAAVVADSNSMHSGSGPTLPILTWFAPH
jgi:uncharacterized protein YraI